MCALRVPYYEVILLLKFHSKNIFKYSLLVWFIHSTILFFWRLPKLGFSWLYEQHLNWQQMHWQISAKIWRQTHYPGRFHSVENPFVVLLLSRYENIFGCDLSPTAHIDMDTVLFDWVIIKLIFIRFVHSISEVNGCQVAIMCQSVDRWR